MSRARRATSSSPSSTTRRRPAPSRRPSPASWPTAITRTPSLNAEMARDVINAYRKEQGLKPLKLNPGADGSRQEPFARPRQVGSHFALRLGRLQPVGSRQAHRLQGAACGRERRHRPDRLQRSHEGLEGKPRPQQEPADRRTPSTWASRWCRTPSPNSNRSGRWCSARRCEQLQQRLRSLQKPTAATRGPWAFCYESWRRHRDDRQATRFSQMAPPEFFRNSG